MRRFYISNLLLLALFTAGCSESVRPVPSIETARLAISEATRNEAEQYAPSELGLAQGKLTLAEREIKEGNMRAGRRLGEQATIDGRYAQVHAQAQKAQAAATENRDTTETIKGTH